MFPLSVDRFVYIRQWRCFSSSRRRLLVVGSFCRRNTPCGLEALLPSLVARVFGKVFELALRSISTEQPASRTARWRTQAALFVHPPRPGIFGGRGAPCAPNLQMCYCQTWDDVVLLNTRLFLAAIDAVLAVATLIYKIL